MARQTDSWDGQEYVHDFDLPFEDQYTYENDLLVSRRTSRTIDSLVYDDRGRLFRRYFLTNFENEDTFRIVDRCIYTHNDEGFLESIVNINSRNIFDELRIVDSLHYRHDDLGNMIEEERYLPNYDSILVDYDLRHRFSYSYEEDTLRSREKRLIPFIEQDTVWGVEERTEYFYNANGRLDHYSIWDIRAGIRRPIFVQDYFYDNSIRNEEVLFFPRDDKYALIEISGRIDNFGYSTSTLGTISGDIVPGIIKSILRPRNTVSTSNVQKLEVSISPNPISDFLSIRLEDSSEEYHLSIFDSAGWPHLVRQSRDTEIDVSRLPSGTYHYSISAGDRVGSGSFVKF